MADEFTVPEHCIDKTFGEIFDRPDGNRTLEQFQCQSRMVDLDTNNYFDLRLSAIAERFGTPQRNPDLAKKHDHYDQISDLDGNDLNNFVPFPSSLYPKAESSEKGTVRTFP